MTVPGERILVVETDPDISDLIVRQALQPLGFQVSAVSDASSALKTATQTPPDLIITNLNLPGLSGKDLLVALSSQGIRAPVIVITEKGQEQDLIQAFRLGASDYLVWPMRETEVVPAVERALKQVREARARQRLDQQVRDTNSELQRKVQELTTILSIGKAVISLTDQRQLFEYILDGAVKVGRADMGWLTLRDEKSKTFLMVAQQNLPDVWAKKINQNLDDGISSLVSLSGETLALHGDALTRFKITSLGKAAVAVPIKVKQDILGLITCVRKAEKPFEQSEQALLEAVTDYASISMVNAQLFRALEQTAELAKWGEKRRVDQLRALRQEIFDEVKNALHPVELLLTEQTGTLNDEQREAILTAQEALQRISKSTEKTVPPPVSPVAFSNSVENG
jgi:DNA-binding response OmpR family regulator